MTRIIIAYFATLVVFAIIDAIWLTQVGPLLYRPIIGSILAPEPRMAPAVIFYALYIAGLITFAVHPALLTGQWQTALIKGALFGFFAYATYDLTNQATLTVWSTRITVADMAWGAFVSGVGSAGGFLLTRLVTRG
ncbi:MULTISPECIES: DUF2177 family protein [unclassified Sphingomonas]|uniref:DUF2177 family protein n=1 Tax=unclassified Sphingomonas TaxID=196159 RepID=UPI0006F89D79|nr:MULTISPECIES: DUF2177 family protein [unclassified Sphingomonas]KQX20274.1 hypothetical protein ASD17_10445 [Sphingomonas sp. Root1294]KQY67524.1 hypothetical protein ASD39_10505 [Sphingomonas sp. Root50]KRB90901.1 hypothetical protein ASE22_11510 [Sphingomonas sp. Root720]